VPVEQTYDVCVIPVEAPDFLESLLGWIHNAMISKILDIVKY
jgi:hypothetical protein